MQTNVKEWLEERNREALKIDAETAEVDWTYAYTLDPYGIDPPPEGYRQVGREYFARRPGSDMWVSLNDLPAHVREALWATHRRKLVFPAGFEDYPF